MKKEGLFTRVKNWFKEYYTMAYTEAKTDKTLGGISMAVIGLGAFASLALAATGGVGGIAFTLAALGTCIEAVDLMANLWMGNQSSFLTRAVMMVGFTAFLPLVAVAEKVITKIQEHSDKKTSAKNAKQVIEDKELISAPQVTETEKFTSNRTSFEYNAPAKETLVEAKTTAPVAKVKAPVEPTATVRNVATENNSSEIDML